MYKFIALLSTEHVKTIFNLAALYIQVANGSHFELFYFRFVSSYMHVLYEL